MIWPEIWPWVLAAVLVIAHRLRLRLRLDGESNPWNRAHSASCRCLDCYDAWTSRAASSLGWSPLTSRSGGKMRVRSCDPGNIP